MVTDKAASMKYKVGIIGHFGFGLDLANGQTIKTKIVADVIKEAVGGDVCYVDAHGGIKAVIPVIGGCIKLLRNCEHVFIFLTENGLKVAVPVLSMVNKLFHRKLHYNVIGGWLPAFLKKNNWLIHHLKQFDYIYVETNTMHSALAKLGLNNCITIPNCKKLQIVKENELTVCNDKPFKLCTFSRVMKEKGIEDIVNVVRTINTEAGKIVYSLDIYGQIDNGQKEWFSDLSKSFPEYIQYGGVIDYNKSVDVLKGYFALVFPTRFYTEGVPGTIVDAYAAGLPVISARWESFSDVIDEGETGIGYDFCDTNDLTRILEKVASSPGLINNMKRDCIMKAQDYTLERLKKNLLLYIR